jgi:hypothetical protein
MDKNIVKKGLTIVVIVLFVTVSFRPVFASDTVSPMKKSDTKEFLETIKDLADNKEIQSTIQKSEIRGSPIRFQQLLSRLLKEIISVIEKNDVLNEKIKQLSDLPCDCEKDNNPLWYPPIFCGFLEALAFIASVTRLLPDPIGEILLNILMSIAKVLNCPWV